MENSEETQQQFEMTEEVITETPAIEEIQEEPAAEEFQEQDRENLADLDKKRMAINADAEEHKRLRDDLNKQTKEWVAKRDELNAKVRELVEEAGKHREARSDFNSKVQSAKDARSAANKEVAELSEKVNEMKKNMPARDKDQPSIKQLKRKYSELEKTQMTTVLSKEKEEALLKEIREVNAKIEEIEKVTDVSGDLHSLFASLKEARNKAEEQHKLVSEYAEKAQIEHDTMLSLYEQADKLRNEADEAQKKFIECKKAADEEHKKHIESIKMYHETDNAVAAIRNKQKSVRKKKTDMDTKKAADDIFARFKNGEKLSTEDLMALQKSGYL